MREFFPRQIVYPLNFRSFFPKKYRSEEEKKLIYSFSNLLKGKFEVFLLGRARMGIYLCTKYALENSNSKNVLLSPFTIPEVINMVITAGGNPIFFDSLEKSFDVDINNLENLITKYNPAGLILTHYHFNQKEILKISEICKKNNFPLFEDSAIAMIQACPKKENISTCKIYSFSAFKTLNYFYGGLIATDDKKFSRFLKSEIKNYPRLKQRQYFKQALKTLIYAVATSKFIFKNVTRRIYIRSAIKKKIIAHRKPSPTIIGEIDSSHFSRPSAAAISELLRKVKNLSIDCNHRREISRVYYEKLNNFVIGSNVDSSDIDIGSCFNFPIFLDKNKEKIYFSLISSGYDVGLHMYDNCHNFPGMESILGNSQNIEKTRKGLIWLPTHPRITKSYASELSEKLIFLINES